MDGNNVHMVLFIDYSKASDQQEISVQQKTFQDMLSVTVTDFWKSLTACIVGIVLKLEQERISINSYSVVSFRENVCHQHFLSNALARLKQFCLLFHQKMSFLRITTLTTNDNTARYN